VLGPTSAKVQADFEKLLSVYRTTVAGRSATYVSTPLTTGERLSDWLHQSTPKPEKGVEYDEQLRKLVIEPNRQAAAQFVARLRRGVNVVVIDPTALPDMPGWSQEDYHSFWGQVIERYASKVVFMDGWNYSSGCTYEFLVAHASHARVLDQAMRPLSRSKGREMIRTAIDKLQSLGLPVAHLETMCISLAGESERLRTA
jgi:hypothetical protein